MIYIPLFSVLMSPGEIYILFIRISFFVYGLRLRLVTVCFVHVNLSFVDDFVHISRTRAHSNGEDAVRVKKLSL